MEKFLRIKQVCQDVLDGKITLEEAEANIEALLNDA